MGSQEQALLKENLLVPSTDPAAIAEFVGYVDKNYNDYQKSIRDALDGNEQKWKESAALVSGGGGSCDDNGDNFQYSYCDYLTDNQEITGCPQPGEEKPEDKNLGYCAYVREAKRLSGCNPKWGKGFDKNNPKRNVGIMKAPFGPELEGEYMEESSDEGKLPPELQEVVNSEILEANRNEERMKENERIIEKSRVLED